jgi:hypothetical protein
MLLGFFAFVCACVALLFAAMFRSDVPQAGEPPAESSEWLEPVYYAKD